LLKQFNNQTIQQINNSTNQQFNNYTNINSGLQPSDVGLLFSPNAAHWAELTRPFRALTAVSRQFRIPPWKGGRGMFISAL